MRGGVERICRSRNLDRELRAHLETGIRERKARWPDRRGRNNRIQRRRASAT